jgi:hypothetical protein
MGLKETIENVHASRKRLERTREAMKKLDEERRRLQPQISKETPKDTGGTRRRPSVN